MAPRYMYVCIYDTVVNIIYRSYVYTNIREHLNKSLIIVVITTNTYDRSIL